MNICGFNLSHLWPATLVFFCAVAFAGEASAQAFSDLEIKSAYILKLARFVTWNGEHRRHVTFCSLEPSNQSDDLSLGQTLAELVRAKRADQDWTIRRFTRLEETGTCDMLFIADTEEGSVAAIVARVEGRNTLTLSDSAGAIYDNVMLGFVIDASNHIRMEANLKAMRSAKVLVSASVLELMTFVLM